MPQCVYRLAGTVRPGRTDVARASVEGTPEVVVPSVRADEEDSEQAPIVRTARTIPSRGARAIPRRTTFTEGKFREPSCIASTSTECPFAVVVASARSAVMRPACSSAMRSLPDCLRLGHPIDEGGVQLVERTHDEAMHPQALRIQRDSGEGRLVHLLGQIEEAVRSLRRGVTPANPRTEPL